MIVRIRGVNRVRARGQWYYYHRKTGTRLPGEPGSPEFMKVLGDLQAKVDALPAKSDGTFGGLARAYLASPEFSALAPRTRADYRKVIDFLTERMGSVPLARIDGPSIFTIRDRTLKLRKRRFANYCVQVLRLLFAWARPRGEAPGLEGNPAADVPQIGRPRDAPIANRAWNDAEVTAVLQAASPALRLPIALGAYLGARQGDVLRMTWSAYDGTGFSFTQGKTGQPLWLPAHARLREILAKARRESPIIVLGVRGKPFTSNGFQREFFKLIRRLEAQGAVGKGLTFHGLRHTSASGSPMLAVTRGISRRGSAIAPRPCRNIMRARLTRSCGLEARSRSSTRPQSGDAHLPTERSRAPCCKTARAVLQNSSRVGTKRRVSLC